jgi:hypothetical protein
MRFAQIENRARNVLNRYVLLVVVQEEREQRHVSNTTPGAAF